MSGEGKEVPCAAAAAVGASVLLSLTECALMVRVAFHLWGGRY